MKHSSSIALTLSALALGTGLGGCNSTLLESKKIDYKSEGKVVSTLEVPPDLTQPTRDDRYVVPDVSPKGTATFSSYSAEREGQPQNAGANAEVLPDVGEMRIERAGTQRWLVVPQPPEKLWPQIKDFWQETGFLVNVEVPEAGILETDWAENRAKIGTDIIRNTLGKLLDSLYSTGERDKFRTRLEAGAQPGTTDVFISHRGMVEVFTNEKEERTAWQPRPSDPELEAEMLRRLMVRLGADEKRAEAIAAAPTQPQRARLEQRAEGSARVIVLEPFDRAWRRVGLALDRIGFTVEDRDRTQGVFFVRYVDPEADANSKKADGILSKLMFWRSSSAPAKSDAQYRVRVASAGTESNVQVLTREGGVDTSDTSRRILSLLYEQLK